MHTIFEEFENGELHYPANTNFADIPWTAAPFEGVELKHIVTAKDTGGQCSFHLVRIAPGKRIGRHTHESQMESHEVVSGSGQCVVYATGGEKRLPYAPGRVAVFPAGLAHEVIADDTNDTGLCLFAKFFPPLC